MASRKVIYVPGGSEHDPSIHGWGCSISEDAAKEGRISVPGQFMTRSGGSGGEGGEEVGEWGEEVRKRRASMPLPHHRKIIPLALTYLDFFRPNRKHDEKLC